MTTDPGGLLADAHHRALAEATLAWSDPWWDPEVGLVWWPPDPAPDGTVPDLPFHRLPQSAWYALGLLLRDGPGDRERAAQAVGAVCADQYDEPGEVWHGTFRLLHESPHPPPDARMWDDYDPNWRQFIGTAFGLTLRHLADRLPAATVDAMDRAQRLAVEGEPPGRVTDNYANIALMKAWLEVDAGRRLDQPDWVQRGEDLARRVADLYRVHGAFEEYNSPTYYGIDLYALALWARHSDSPVLTELGTALEADLWRDSARWYHADLGNVCGPYTRSYGMDLHDYVGAWSVWVAAACGLDAAPLPPLDRPMAHGMDLMLGPAVALLGAVVPDDARAHLEAFGGERLVEQRIDAEHAGDRVATGWLGPDVMLGAERNAVDLSWWDQFHQATAHWRAADGSVGWLRATVPGPSDATVEPRRLTLVWHHGPGEPGASDAPVEAAEAGDDARATFRVRAPGGDLGPLHLATDGEPLEVAERPDGVLLSARRRTGSDRTTFVLSVR